MDNFLLLVICFAAGIILRRLALVPDDAGRTVNAVIIYMALPAVALDTIHAMPLSPALIMPALMGWIVFGAGLAVFALAGRMMNLDRATVGCLALTAGLGNTSFVGLPMIEAFYGPNWLGLGLVCDQAGSFMALSIAGVAVAAWASGKEVNFTKIVLRIVTFPPFLAVMAALALKPLAYPDWVAGTLESLGATLAPLALLSIGFGISLKTVKGRSRELFLGLGYKMILAPLGILALYAGVMDMQGTAVQVTVFEAAMPPMVTGGIVAVQYGLRPRLAALLLGAGVLACFATLPVWWWLARGI